MEDTEVFYGQLERLAIVLDEIMPGCATLVRDTLELLKEQEDKIRQLRLALQIMKGNGIKVNTESR